MSPRVGLTYAADEARKTVIRASYAMFASQLPGDEAKFVSPIQYSYAYYNAVDRNGDGIAQLSELLINQGLTGFTGIRSEQPVALVDGEHGRSERQGADHARTAVRRRSPGLGPNVGVSATFTYRRMVDLIWDPLTGVKPSDYTQTGTLSGTIAEVGSYSVPLYALRAAAVPAGGGETETNRAGLSPALSRSRAQRDQADVQSLDGALRLLDQRLARVLR